MLSNTDRRERPVTPSPFAAYPPSSLSFSSCHPFLVLSFFSVDNSSSSLFPSLYYASSTSSSLSISHHILPPLISPPIRSTSQPLTYKALTFPFKESLGNIINQGMSHSFSSQCDALHTNRSDSKHSPWLGAGLQRKSPGE